MQRDQSKFQTFCLPENASISPNSALLPHIPDQWLSSSFRYCLAFYYKTQLDGILHPDPITPKHSLHNSSTRHTLPACAQSDQTPVRLVQNISTVSANQTRATTVRPKQTPIPCASTTSSAQQSR